MHLHAHGIAAHSSVHHRIAPGSPAGCRHTTGSHGIRPKATNSGLYLQAYCSGELERNCGLPSAHYNINRIAHEYKYILTSLLAPWAAASMRCTIISMSTPMPSRSTSSFLPAGSATGQHGLRSLQAINFMGSRHFQPRHFLPAKKDAAR